MYDDLAFSDISNDDMIQCKDEGLQLHKMSQYAMQYLMHNINLLKDNKKRLEGEIDSTIVDEEKSQDIAKVQQDKIEELQRQIDAIDAELDDEKNMMEFDKRTHEEREEMIQALKNQLKLNYTTLDASLPEVKDFKRIMASSD